LSAAYAHGDEDHGAPPPPVTQSMAPRAVAATEEFEVVAVLEGQAPAWCMSIATPATSRSPRR
jgi:hypothetical protein